MVWQGQALPAKEHAASVRFTYVSKDGEEGFPGTMTVSVTYTVTDDNEMRLDYEATTDKPTLVESDQSWLLQSGRGRGFVRA